MFIIHFVNPSHKPCIGTAISLASVAPCGNLSLGAARGPENTLRF